LLLHSLSYLAHFSPTIGLTSETGINRVSGFPAWARRNSQLVMSIPTDLLTATAEDLQKLLTEGKVTSRSVLDAYLTQIEKLNPRLHAITSIVPRELLYQQADVLDVERATGNVRGPLHGVPIVIKDAICTGHSRGLTTTLGATAFEGATAKKDASIVSSLEQEGAIVLAKASMTEFCGTKGSNLTTGWSPINGQTQSAYVEGGVRGDDLILGHSTPGGSSTGSAVSVSAGFSPLALGTETDGSATGPAHRAGLYGFKVASGTVPMDGVFRLTSFDTIGVMAKAPADIANSLNAIVKPSMGLDVSKLKTANFGSLAVGFVDPALWRLPEVICAPDEKIRAELDQGFMDAMAKIKSAGATVAYPVVLPSPSTLNLDGADHIGTTLFHELKENFRNFTDLLVDPKAKTLEDVIEFNKAHADREMPREHPDQSALIKGVEDTSTEDFVKSVQAHVQHLARAQGIDKALDEHGVDVIVAPGDSPITSLTTSADYPVAAVPNGVLSIYGRPHGLSVLTRAGNEMKLMEFMFAFYNAFPSRPVPCDLDRFDAQL